MLLLAGAVLAPLAVAAVALPQGGGRAVVVSERSGDELLAAKLPSSGTFSIAYRHSYYGAPAREIFSASADGGFRLRAIESPRAAVLDYYALAGNRTRRGRWLRLVPAERPRYEQLALIATEVGRRTLVVGGRRLPLYVGKPRHLTISVENGA